jgi:hypothetical protein
MLIDGIELAKGEQVLLTNQTPLSVSWRQRLANWWRRVRGKPEQDSDNNGPYFVSSVGVEGGPPVLKRDPFGYVYFRQRAYEWMTERARRS